MKFKNCIYCHEGYQPHRFFWIKYKKKCNMCKGTNVMKDDYVQDFAYYPQPRENKPRTIYVTSSLLTSGDIGVHHMAFNSIERAETHYKVCDRKIKCCWSIAVSYYDDGERV